MKTPLVSDVIFCVDAPCCLCENIFFFFVFLSRTETPRKVFQEGSLQLFGTSSQLIALYANSPPVLRLLSALRGTSRCDLMHRLDVPLLLTPTLALSLLPPSPAVCFHLSVSLAVNSIVSVRPIKPLMWQLRAALGAICRWISRAGELQGAGK